MHFISFFQSCSVDLLARQTVEGMILRELCWRLFCLWELGVGEGGKYGHESEGFNRVASICSC
jgi:hypothetical protein